MTHPFAVADEETSALHCEFLRTLGTFEGGCAPHDVLSDRLAWARPIYRSICRDLVLEGAVRLVEDAVALSDVRLPAERLM